MYHVLLTILLLSAPLNHSLGTDNNNWTTSTTPLEINEISRLLPGGKIYNLHFFEDIDQWINGLSDNILNKEVLEDSLLHKLIPFFLILMLGFVITIVFILLVFFIIKISRYRRDRKRLYIGRQYQYLLTDYLINKPEYNIPRFPGLQFDSRKKILISHLYELGKSLYGKKQYKLQHLYDSNNFNPFIIRKIRSGSWFVKAIYLQYLSTLPFRKCTIKNLSRFTRSKNPQVRLYSQVAHISQCPDRAFSFLEGYPYILTDWDQLNLYETMLNNSIPVPDPYSYLQSGNSSVVIFCLRLIRWYYLKKKSHEELLRLIFHPNRKIRLETYITLMELRIRGLEDIFIYHYGRESKDVEKTMIDYFGGNKRITSQMLHELLLIENDPDLRMYLLGSYYNQSFNSRKEIMRLREQTEDDALRSMCDHVIENTF